MCKIEYSELYNTLYGAGPAGCVGLLVYEKMSMAILCIIIISC